MESLQQSQNCWFQWKNLRFLQCCQLLADFSGHSRRNIMSLRKEIQSPSNFSFWRTSAFRKTLDLSVWVGKQQYFLDFHRSNEDNRRGTNVFQVQPLFGPFCSKLVKIRPGHCPAAPLFIWPLTYAVEQSASWHQWIFGKKPRKKNWLNPRWANAFGFFTIFIITSLSSQGLAHIWACVRPVVFFSK